MIYEVGLLESYDFKNMLLASAFPIKMLEMQPIMCFQWTDTFQHLRLILN